MIRNVLTSTCMFGLICGAAATASAVSEAENNKTVSLLAANGVQASVVVNNVGPSAACFLSGIVFNPTTAMGRIWYATLLEALSTNAAVDVQYDRSGTLCTITQINIR